MVEGAIAVAALRRLVLERLTRYYGHLTREYAKNPLVTVTSAQIGAALDVEPSQVRKDFGAVGLSGVSRVGYQVCDVCRAIRRELGFDEPYAAVLVGVGHLGSALLNYASFEQYGLVIVAAFDGDNDKVGEVVGDLAIRSVHTLKRFIEENEVSVAVLTTPVEVSQRLAELVVDAGVKAIWNFTPRRLTVPDDVLVRNEHISVGLAEIAYHLNLRRPGPRPAVTEACDPERNCALGTASARALLRMAEQGPESQAGRSQPTAGPAHEAADVTR